MDPLFSSSKQQAL
jgi:hypothetical protein